MEYSSRSTPTKCKLNPIPNNNFAWGWHCGSHMDQKGNGAIYLAPLDYSCHLHDLAEYEACGLHHSWYCSERLVSPGPLRWLGGTLEGIRGILVKRQENKCGNKIPECGGVDVSRPVIQLDSVVSDPVRTAWYSFLDRESGIGSLNIHQKGWPCPRIPALHPQPIIQRARQWAG